MGQRHDLRARLKKARERIKDLEYQREVIRDTKHSYRDQMMSHAREIDELRAKLEKAEAALEEMLSWEQEDHNAEAINEALAAIRGDQIPTPGSETAASNTEDPWLKLAECRKELQELRKTTKLTAEGEVERTGCDTRYGSPVFCEHANEVPGLCPCEPLCYCKAHTCKPGRW